MFAPESGVIAQSYYTAGVGERDLRVVSDRVGECLGLATAESDSIDNNRVPLVAVFCSKQDFSPTNIVVGSRVSNL